MYKRPLGKRGDIVLASAGGYPKDINFYQAQKALDYASLAVKDGGTIILLAECSEGIGSDSLSGFLQNAASWDLVVDRGRQKKSYHPYGLRGLVGRGIEVFLVSEIPQELIETTPLRPFHQIGTALDVALEKHGSVAGIVLMPYAGSTLPCG
ncbi:MAG: hypothetical protein Q8P44_06125 [Dehalococcoidia bacterium]|nr:hypothetical protein [Dehalococcoidia bacterium]